MEKPTTLKYLEKYAPSLAWVAASLEPFGDRISNFYAGPQDGSSEPEFLSITVTTDDTDHDYRITARGVFLCMDGDYVGEVSLGILWLTLRSLPPTPYCFAKAGGAVSHD